MPRTWTVIAKVHICSEIPKGFTIQVATQQNCHDYPSLRKALRDRGLPFIGGHEHDGSWEWI